MPGITKIITLRYCRLVSSLLSLIFFIHSTSVNAEEPIWERVCEGMINGKRSPMLYLAGVENSIPAFCDIDGDGDYDLFVGENYGEIYFWSNDGTASTPSWTMVTENYESIDVGNNCAPTFCDIDGDGDYDLFIGEAQGNINFWRNDGTPVTPSWTLVAQNYEWIDVGWYSVPTFCDIDGDSDYDMFIGESTYGRIHFWRNDGTPTTPSWTFVTDNYETTILGSSSTPKFCDIDGDDDYDLFIGEFGGTINFFRNNGTPTMPSWILVTENYASINVGLHSTPSFCDIDGDDDFDMFIGESDGNINFWRNDGTLATPSWTFMTDNYSSIDVGYSSAPAFCDIDGDGDFDLFFGQDGAAVNIYFYRNDGTPITHSWTLVAKNYMPKIVGWDIAPTFCDIDGDDDYDLFVGDYHGNIHFYQNDGTPQTPSWTFVTEDYESIDVGYSSIPTFCDIDGDDDYDLFIGEFSPGNINFWRNDGTPTEASWAFITDNYESTAVFSCSAPTFCDIDGDDDLDLFIGEQSGELHFWRNDGTPTTASWTFVTEYYGSVYVLDWSIPIFCDIDGNGDYDMFIGNHDGRIYYARNTSPKLLISPPSVTLPSETSRQFTISNASGGVNWILSNNRSGGSVDPSTGFYSSGSTAGVIDAIKAEDSEGTIGMAYANVISASQISACGKAVICSGRKLNDYVWPSTNYLANNAYLTLRHRGFSKDNIYYLSPDTNQDVDNDGSYNDIDAFSCLTGIEYALTTFASDADKLFIYLVDHGREVSGEGYFRLSQSEELTAQQLDTWLDSWQTDTDMELVVALDCCHSGSFVDELLPPGGMERVTIASCASDQATHFVAGGLVSFSECFFNCVQAGYDLEEAFLNARGAMDRFQSAQLDDNGDGAWVKETDGSYASTIHIGATFVAGLDRPTVGLISPNQEITEGSAATLWADNVSGVYPIEKVWCVIVPPTYNPGDEGPVTELPEVELLYHDTNERYEGSYDGFSQSGAYSVIFFAQDIWGGVSFPKQSYVTQSGYKEKVILAAGGPQGGPVWDAANYLGNYAYRTCLNRWLQKEQIYYLNPDTFQDVDGNGTADDVSDTTTYNNLQYAISTWAPGTDNDLDKLTVYLVGQGQTDEFTLNGSETLDPSNLDVWLDTLQNNCYYLQVVTVFDFSNSGSFLNDLLPPVDKERVNIAGTDYLRCAFLDNEGKVSFSQYFFNQVFSGANLKDAFAMADQALKYISSYDQDPQLDDDGDGVPNEKNEDFLLAQVTHIGPAFVTGNDLPDIGTVCDDRVITGGTSAAIWAEDISDADDIDRVWAVVMPPGCTCLTVESLPEVELTDPEEDERYEGTYTEFTEAGDYSVLVYASDTEENVSQPRKVTVTQGDAYEPDNYYYEANSIDIDGTPQSHNFHAQSDRDWVMFFAQSGTSLKVEAFNCQSRCDPTITLYQSDISDWNELSEIKFEDSWGPGQTETMNFNPIELGLYYVEVNQYDGSVYGENTGYDLIVARQTGDWELLSVWALDKSNPGEHPPGTEVSLNEGAFHAFIEHTDNTSLGPGEHKVEVRASGWVAWSNYSDPDDYRYGNPRNVDLEEDGAAFPVFLFVPAVITPTPTPSPRSTATPTPSVSPVTTPTPSPSATPCFPPLIIGSGDYDGDGTSDIAIFRGSSSLWAVRGLTRCYFGSSDDIPICGDYDGDLSAEIGIFRNSSGLWAIRAVTRLYFGSASDLSIPGDYDGDGCCDVGIFRAVSGLWAIRDATRVYFGALGDQPVPGDYDGDGARDIAVFRGSSGLWALRNISRVYFGSGSDTVVPGDYDGDGTWSPAIFRASSGLWALRTITRAYFGGLTDRPVPADYDGDLADDVAIFREATGLWAIRGMSRAYYGTTGDIPVTR